MAASRLAWTLVLASFLFSVPARSEERPVERELSLLGKNNTYRFVNTSQGERQ